MMISSLKLTNFRSWLDYVIDFNDVTILIGPNGIGKTNIIEAVWLLSSGRSWRTSKDAELIGWAKEYSRLELYGLKQDKELKIELFWSVGENKIKQLKVNNVKHRLLDLLGVMPTVIFSPETIAILDGAPGLRRRFLDIMLSEVEHKYALSLSEYNKVLKERNKLLALIKNSHGKDDELDFWDNKLVENGRLIMLARKKAINFFNAHLEEAYESLSGRKGKMALKYHESADPERLEETLFAHRERDIQQTNTLVGAHRDDWAMYLDNRDITTFGSRGEFRTGVLALKLAELKYVEDITREKAILLLDDIFSELDADRRRHLAKMVEGQQTIIATTDLDHIAPELKEKAKIIRLK